jgi:mevalonate kinase
MKKFNAKVLLIGEYSILRGSAGITIPYRKFGAQLQFFDKTPDRNALESNVQLRKFCNYLKDSDFGLKYNWDIAGMERALDAGLYLHSTIPQKYGLGSSGALVTCVYDAYGHHEFVAHDNLSVRNMLGKAESYFHGQSSGTDPLSILLGVPLRFSGNDIEQIPPAVLHQVTRKFYLFDTNDMGGTEELVNGFHRLFDDAGFKAEFESRYYPSVNSIVQNIERSGFLQFTEMLHLISDFQFRFFRQMIPDDCIPLWRNGLKTGEYLFKLCGSGGGGFLLVYSELEKPELERKLKSELLSLE